jgi:Protein of unknown function (DUF4232)
MKKARWSKHGILRMLFAFVALSMLFFQDASAQGKQDFAHGKSLAAERCHENQLSVRHVGEDAAMGGVRTTDFAFTNTSSSPCTLKGYPRFEVLNRSGRLVRGGLAARGLTRLGDEAKAPPRLVTIEPGKTATFQVYYNAGGAGYMGKPCPTYRKVKITAPGTKRGFVLREELQLCSSLEVSPVGWPAKE